MPPLASRHQTNQKNQGNPSRVFFALRDVCKVTYLTPPLNETALTQKVKFLCVSRLVAMF